MAKVEIENNTTTIEFDHKNSADRVSMFIVTHEEDETDSNKEIEKKMRINISLDECKSLIYYLKATMKNVVEQI